MNIYQTSTKMECKFIYRSNWMAIFFFFGQIYKSFSKTGFRFTHVKKQQREWKLRPNGEGAWRNCGVCAKFSSIAAQPLHRHRRHTITCLHLKGRHYFDLKRKPSLMNCNLWLCFGLISFTRNARFVQNTSGTVRMNQILGHPKESRLKVHSVFW